MPTHREIVDRMPLALAKRPRTANGYPVPWFTPKVDGEWDFKHILPGKVERAVAYELCWVCGEPLGELPVAFVVGPMCIVNRNSAEPPCHVPCAVYSAKACPFLARPKMVRPSGLTGVSDGRNEDTAIAGISLNRNPGVAAVYVTRHPSYDLEYKLFDLGEPERVVFYAHSRKATRDEVMESITTGLPVLMDMAESEGPEAVDELTRLVERAMPLVPA